MNITITGRHINISDSLKAYAEKKIDRLVKYFTQLIDAHVILFVEKQNHVAEVIINGDGVQFHGREQAADLYSSIDLLFEKMERQIVRYKERHQAHKGPEKGEIVPVDVTLEGGSPVVLNQVSNRPLDRVEAYLQMKLARRNYILFKKGEGKIDAELPALSKNYAIMFRNGDSLKMVEIPVEALKSGAIDTSTFVEYNLTVVSDSPTNPNIEFTRNAGASVPVLSLEDAVKAFSGSNAEFMAFYNAESHYFNVIAKNGNAYEVLVPAY